MNVNIRLINMWHAHCEQQPIKKALEITDKHNNDWPKLAFVPAMQRRRLSAFAKMSLLVAQQTLDGIEQELPIVFSSRHGDMEKTSRLLADLAEDTPISPTAFGLSVHNAIPSLFSILTGNKQAINAISAGKDSFFMALIDIYGRLKSGLATEVLFIHADQALPKTYEGFQDEQQLSHAIAMVVSLPEQADDNSISLTLNYQAKQGDIIENEPLSLAFFQWLDSNQQYVDLVSNQYVWSLEKHV